MPLAASWALCPQHSPTDETSRRTGDVDNLGGHALGIGLAASRGLTALLLCVTSAPGLRHSLTSCITLCCALSTCGCPHTAVGKLTSLLLLLLLALLSNTVAVCVSFCLRADLSDHFCLYAAVFPPHGGSDFTNLRDLAI